MELTIAVVSDPHFFSKHLAADADPSWLGLSRGPSPQLLGSDNPWTGLSDLISSKSLKADLLLCPGDITTWADRDALTVAWEKLITLGDQLQGHLVAAATGNHDVWSRPDKRARRKVTKIREMDNPIDLFESLKLLSPSYPIHELTASGTAHSRRVQYFGADYVIHDSDPRYRLVVFNSCGRHTSDADTYERGRVADSSLGWLEADLASLAGTQKKVNILLCHHHPILHEDCKLGSYDFMQNGSRLLDLLPRYGDWVVFHGHKHHPRLVYAQGSAAPPVVFSAGSLSAMPTALASRAPNQFYLIDIPLDSGTSGLHGTVRAWNWTRTVGWQPALRMEDGIYYGCGFGEHRHHDDVAKDIFGAFVAPSMAWANVLTAIPYLQHVTPKDLTLICQRLETTYGLCLQPGIHSPELSLTKVMP